MTSSSYCQRLLPTFFILCHSQILRPQSWQRAQWEILIFTQGPNTSCTQSSYLPRWGSLPRSGQCPTGEEKAHLGKSVQVLEVPCAALITLVMISNPAAVVGRPEANGHAPVPPHDALCTRLNPLLPPKEPGLSLGIYSYHFLDCYVDP